MNDRELLGTVWEHEKTGGGRFHCPHCRATRAYAGTRMQRRVTVLGRPLTPLGGPEDFVTCERCGHAWVATVLDGSSAPGREGLAEDESALLGVVSAMVFSDSVVRDAEKEACRAVVLRYTGRRLETDGVVELLRSARPRWGDPVARLRRVRFLIPDRVKRRMVEAAYLICAADGELHREESELLDRIGDALDLGPRDVHRAIAEARTSPTA